MPNSILYAFIDKFMIITYRSSDGVRMLNGLARHEVVAYRNVLRADSARGFAAC